MIRGFFLEPLPIWTKKTLKACPTCQFLLWDISCICNYEELIANCPLGEIHPSASFWTFILWSLELHVCHLLLEKGHLLADCYYQPNATHGPKKVEKDHLAAQIFVLIKCVRSSVGCSHCVTYFFLTVQRLFWSKSNRNRVPLGSPVQLHAFSTGMKKMPKLCIDFDSENFKYESYFYESWMTFDWMHEWDWQYWE